jgi:ribosome-binding factor A
MNRQTVLTPDERTWLEAQRVDLMADYAQANLYADALHTYADADMATLRAATMHAWMTAYQILNGNDRGPIAR